MDLAPWFWAVISLAVVLVAVDRLMAAADARRVRRGAPARVRPRSSGVTTGGPGFGDIVEIFQPTARYLHEEQERQRHDLVEAGDADPDWEVDLDAATVRLPPPPSRDDPAR